LFFQQFKTKIICGYKKGVTEIFFSPLSFVVVFGSGIRDPGWVKIRIRDKHPGSATQAKKKHCRKFNKMHLDVCGKMCVAPLIHQIGSILQDLLIYSEGQATEIVIQ
jgi:hypothetical protein